MSDPDYDAMKKHLADSEAKGMVPDYEKMRELLVKRELELRDDKDFYNQYANICQAICAVDLMIDEDCCDDEPEYDGPTEYRCIDSDLLAQKFKRDEFTDMMIDKMVEAFPDLGHGIIAKGVGQALEECAKPEFSGPEEVER